MDFEKLRKRMVTEQISARGIADKRVLEAFLKVPRHLFIPDAMHGSSYADYPVPIGECQTISQPYIVALMTESLHLSGNEKVLEVGTGSGYQAAILAELAGDVYTVERLEGLNERAQKILAQLGYGNVHTRCADGTLGWPEESPFERILITAATPSIPQPLIEQLAEGGRIVAPVGERFSQMLILAQKNEGRITETPVCGCVFVPLLGKHGFKNQ